MEIQTLVIILTLFMIVNAYYDNKYIEIIKNGKKYYIMLGYLFVGLSVIYFIKKIQMMGQI